MKRHGTDLTESCQICTVLLPRFACQVEQKVHPLVGNLLNLKSIWIKIKNSLTKICLGVIWYGYFPKGGGFLFVKQISFRPNVKKNKVCLKRIYVSIDDSPRNPNKNTFWKTFHQRLVTPLKTVGDSSSSSNQPESWGWSSGNLPKLLRAFFVEFFTGLKPKKRRNNSFPTGLFPADFSRDLSTRPGGLDLENGRQKTLEGHGGFGLCGRNQSQWHLERPAVSEPHRRLLRDGLVGWGWVGLEWVVVFLKVWVVLFFAKKTHLNVFEGLQNMEIFVYFGGIWSTYMDCCWVHYMQTTKISTDSKFIDVFLLKDWFHDTCIGFKTNNICLWQEG